MTKWTFICIPHGKTNFKGSDRNFSNVQFVVSTHALEVINSVLREQVIVLENYQALPAPMETYGKGRKWHLRAIMRVKNDQTDIMEQFDAFYHAIDLHDYMQADEILSNLEELLGDDPELAAMRVQLELEQI